MYWRKVEENKYEGQVNVLNAWRFLLGGFRIDGSCRQQPAARQCNATGSALGPRLPA